MLKSDRSGLSLAVGVHIVDSVVLSSLLLMRRKVGKRLEISEADD